MFRSRLSEDRLKSFIARLNNSHNLNKGRSGSDTVEPVHKFEVLLNPLIVNKSLENQSIANSNTVISDCNFITKKEIALSFSQRSGKKLQVVSRSILGFFEFVVKNLFSEDSLKSVLGRRSSSTELPMAPLIDFSTFP